MRLSLLVVLAVLAGCASGPAPRPELAELPEPWVGLRESCEIAGEMATCPRRVVARSAEDSLTLWGQAATLAERLTQCEGLAGVDAAEAGQRLQATRAEADSARAQRWLWGGLGLVTGAVLVLVAGSAI